MTELTSPTLGVTLYSFTNEWVMGRYTLPELLTRIAQEGIGPGVEIVGFQSVRGYPALTPGFIREFRDSVETNGLTPSSLSANIDTGLRRDRYLTSDEKVDYLLPQIEAARVLGFPVLRIQIGADPDVLERVAPAAEKAGVRLGMEIHAPDWAHTPRVQAVAEFYDRVDSPALGFIPDFGSTMHDITPGLLRSFVDQGFPADLVPDLRAVWAEGGPVGERLARFREMASSRGASDQAIGIASFAFTMNGHADPASWADFGARIFHVHGKFYAIDEDGDEPSIDYPANIAALVRAGFHGTISSEWEGHAYTLEKDLDTFAMIRRHHDLIRRSLRAASR